MVVSNLTMTGSDNPLVTKVTANYGNNKPVASGNVLPAPSQTGAQSESTQDLSAKNNLEQLQQLVGQANQATLVRNSNLKFTVAEGTDVNVVRIEDSETGELIRQIPSEHMIAISRALEESQQGMMLQERV